MLYLKKSVDGVSIVTRIVPTKQNKKASKISLERYVTWSQIERNKRCKCKYFKGHK